MPALGPVRIYRGIWIDAESESRFRGGEPILPRGIGSEDELEDLVRTAIRNFGSLRSAAIHHLTGATGVEPNRRDRPVFTFWPRQRAIALATLRRGRVSTLSPVLLLLAADVARGPRVVIARESGLYRERISDYAEDTLADIEPVDE